MTINPPSTLVLFDIDGTLLDLHGAGRKSFALALAEAFGWMGDIDYISFAGATDIDVLDQIFRRNQRALTPDDVSHFFTTLPRKLADSVKNVEATIYPGVPELIEQLSAHPDVIIGLVTGNIEACAYIKLEKANLHGHFQLGAFGHEHGDRKEIARLAKSRAEAQLPPGASFTKIYLIGDTPSDIAAARYIDATAIAVATGSYTVDQLHAAGADHVVTTLEPVADLIFRKK
ncbi:MAG TPA: HAD hydrolase-like protein [Kiritimatiellia bacterium]|mgnify:CR=1 FL=1|nr:HAD hydrolase-like protein [Kiritimatiellia bacterium]